MLHCNIFIGWAYTQNDPYCLQQHIKQKKDRGIKATANSGIVKTTVNIWLIGDVAVKSVIFKLMSSIDLSISCESALRWMPQDINDNDSALFQVMAWCHQLTSHHLNQCCLRPMTPYGLTRPQWAKTVKHIQTDTPMFIRWTVYEVGPVDRPDNKSCRHYITHTYKYNCIHIIRFWWYLICFPHKSSKVSISTILTNKSERSF